MPSQPTANDGQFPSLHAIWPSFVFSTAHRCPIGAVARPLVQEKAQARFPPRQSSPSAGGSRGKGCWLLLGPRTARGWWMEDEPQEPHADAEHTRLARLAGLTSPSRRHLLACAALCDREAARVRRPLCPPAIHIRHSPTAAAARKHSSCWNKRCTEGSGAWCAHAYNHLILAPALQTRLSLATQGPGSQRCLTSLQPHPGISFG